MARRPHADRARHRRLQVRAAHHRHAVVDLAEVDECRREVRQLPFEAQELVLDVEAHVHRNLVVAAAARVDLLAEVAQRLRQARLHGHVDILVLLAHDEEAVGHHVRKRGAHARGLLLRHDGRGDGHLRKHRHV